MLGVNENTNIFDIAQVVMPDGKMRFTNIRYGTRFAWFGTGTPLMIDTRHILNKRKLISFQTVTKHLFNTKIE